MMMRYINLNAYSLKNGKNMSTGGSSVQKVCQKKNLKKIKNYVIVGLNQ